MADGNDVSREHLAELLNEDLAREYQAIIGYVVYSQVLSGAQYMDIAAQLEIHAKQELDHALIISRQIDYLGKMPAVNVTPRQSPEGSSRVTPQHSRCTTIPRSRGFSHHRNVREGLARCVGEV